MTKSPRKSFKGYSLWTALARNVDSIKAIVAILAAINVVGFDWKVFSMTLLAAGIALVTKLLADAVDFFFGEVDL